MVMGLTTLVKTSFVLSGLLGLRLEGIPDGKGGTLNLDMALPIQIGCANQTASIKTASTIMNTNSAKNNSNFKTPSGQPSNKRPVGYQYSKPNHPSFNKLVSMRRGKPHSNLRKGINIELTPPPLPVDFSGNDIDDNYDDLMPPSPSKCGSLTCNTTEMCVSWMKVEQNGNNEVPTPKLKRIRSKTPPTRGSKIFECLENDGLFHPKVNPKTSKLCPPGQTHSIINDPQPCLKDNPPCQLNWKYKCVKESESPHNCKLKSCPLQCIELIVCGQHPPCVVDAMCLNPADLH